MNETDYSILQNLAEIQKNLLKITEKTKKTNPITHQKANILFVHKISVENLKHTHTPLLFSNSMNLGCK